MPAAITETLPRNKKRVGPGHPDAHLCEPSPQRTPVLYQVGGSRRGKDFAVPALFRWQQTGKSHESALVYTDVW